MRTNGRSEGNEEEEWNWRELSRYFLGLAAEAQRRLWEIRDQQQRDSHWQEAHDLALADYSVYQCLWGRTYLRSREGFLAALQLLREQGRPEEGTPCDAERFFKAWKQRVAALIESYRR